MFLQLETLETKEVPEIRKKVKELGKEIETLRGNLTDVSSFCFTFHSFRPRRGFNMLRLFPFLSFTRAKFCRQVEISSSFIAGNGADNP